MLVEERDIGEARKEWKMRNKTDEWKKKKGKKKHSYLGETKSKGKRKKKKRYKFILLVSS